MPLLQYPITRNFPGRAFSYAAFAGAAVVLLFLAVLNAAVGGYETVPSYSSDFNVTENHWFDKFLRATKPKPGSLCDPRLLSLGETITTNYTMFECNNCDITSLFVNADSNTFIIDFAALVTCKADEYQIQQDNRFDIIARADWSTSYLSGMFRSPLGAQKALRNMQSGTYNKSSDARGSALNTLLATSGTESADRVYNMLLLSNRTTPQIISFQADFPWCPASLGRGAPSAAQVPLLNIKGMFELLGNGFLHQNSTGGLLTDDTTGIISNMVQALYAAVRLDLGNPSSNNFLLNTTVIPQAFQATFPQTYPGQGNITLPTDSYLHSALVNDGKFSKLTGGVYDIPGLLPLSVPGPAIFDGVYLCRFQRGKSAGSGFIAVLIGTLSTFLRRVGNFPHAGGCFGEKARAHR
ncbi:hypothetical protein DFH08DRAFT_978591 [Mycena albidolilacea]|uniref:Uncharacterized protein n=1 Tax=Mycena albidolilacea TaxID=1033008 RepID=A0AAD6YYF6_9AGAR|nr:hypothetical protein DFH08DRAFT_978591 [Mycena albidolilacea]